jgi:hypothetical protein
MCNENIDDIAMRNGWMSSNLVYVGTFQTADCDDVFALFRDTEHNKNFPLAIKYLCMKGLEFEKVIQSSY